METGLKYRVLIGIDGSYGIGEAMGGWILIQFEIKAREVGNSAKFNIMINDLRAMSKNQIVV